MDELDFIMNGQGFGSVANILLNSGMDVHALRPFVAENGRTYVTVNVGGQLQVRPVFNTQATLRQDEWKLIDGAVIKAAKPRLRFVADLRAAGLTYSVPNAMGKTVLEYERQSDISPAVMSMDGIRQSNADRPEYDLAGLPLPIIHKDFFFTARQIATSRNGGSPLDTTTAELAAQKVAEMAEQLALGKLADYTYAGYTIQGLTNYANRLTKVLTAPTAQGWTPATLVNEILEMKLQSQQAYHYGPWMVYNSPSWDVFMDDDYSASKGDNTLRERIKKIDGIQDVRTLDYLTSYELVLVQMTGNVVREVIGMDVSTVQWESHGGMQVNFKVMAIMVPQFRCDQNSRTGLVHGATAG